MKDFREFLLRGNLVDMAVGIVIGVAFGAVVTALVSDLITPLIAAIGGQADFSTLRFKINGSQFLYGSFFNAADLVRRDRGRRVLLRRQAGERAPDSATGRSRRSTRRRTNARTA